MALGSKLKSAMGWVGLVDDERYLPAETPQADPEPVVEDHPSAQSAETPVVPVAPQPPAPVIQGYPGDNNATVFLATGLLVTPTSYQGIQPTCDRYLGGLVTVVNLRAMPLADAFRSLDFFQGMAYALQGRVRRLADKVFLLVPVGARVDDAAIDEVLAELS